MTRPHTLVPLGARSVAVMVAASLVGLLAFAWPLVVPIQQGASHALSHSHDAPWLFVLLLPMLAAVVLASIAEGGMDAKVVALLGMLTAVGAGLRVLSPGAGGLEPAFFLLVVAGYAFGPGFGFVLGALSLFAGALLSGGVGPWLPFQMFASAWVGAFGGLLPHRFRRTGARPGEPSWVEVGTLAAWGLISGLLYGIVMNLWFWPFATFESALTFRPGASAAHNLAAYARFYVVTSLGWDLPRGITTAVLLLAFARPLLRAFARVSRKAAFGERAGFVPSRDGDAAREGDAAQKGERAATRG